MRKLAALLFIVHLAQAHVANWVTVYFRDSDHSTETHEQVR
jgi:hypothetical protein